MAVGKYFLMALFLGVTLTACGGGGGGGGGTKSSASSSVVNPSVALQKLTRTNTPVMAGALVDLIGFSKSIPNELMSNFAPVQGLQDGEYTVACDNAKSTYTATLSKSGKKLEESFKECVFDGVHYSGSRTIEIDTQKSTTIAVANFSWSNFKVYDVATPAESESLTGSLNYEGRGPLYTDNDNNFLVKLNLEIHSSTEGTLVIKQGIFNLAYPNSLGWDRYGYYFSDGQALSGTLSLSGVGAVSFSATSQYRVITLLGSDNSKAYIDPAISTLEIAVDENGDGRRDSNVNVMPYDFSYSVGLSDLVHRPENKVELRTDVNNPIPTNKELIMGRGGHLLIDISKMFVHSSVELLDYDLQVNGFSSAIGNWAQTDLGIFDLTFSGNTIDETYKLTFIAKDQHGAKYEHSVNLFIGADFDQDNIPDVKDKDDDNDGVIDHLDKFPLDPLDSKDTDNDGIGDNRDPDSDNDGVLNSADAYPLDKRCSLASAGNGRRCYSNYSADVWFMDAAGIVYSELYRSDEFSGENVWYSNRWNSRTGEFMPALKLYAYYENFYLKNSNQIFSLKDDDIYAIDLNTGEPAFKMSLPASSVINYIEDNHMVISRRITGTVPYKMVVESYNMNGQLINAVDMVEFEGRQIPVIAPRLSRYCESYISTNAEGVVAVVQGARQTTRCIFGGVGTVSYSPDRSRYYASLMMSNEPAAIYSADHSLIFTVANDGSMEMLWTRAGFVVVKYDSLVFYNAVGESSVKFTYPTGEEYINAANNDDEVVVLTRDSATLQLRMRIFDKELNLMSVKDY